MSSPIDRRRFLRRSAATSLGFVGLRRALSAPLPPCADGYGPLIPDPAGVLDLPEGFGYAVFALQGAPIHGGLVMPGRHDGMTTFATNDGNIVVVRNHEVADGSRDGAFGPNNEWLAQVPRKHFYDYGFGRTPGLGGVTVSIYDPVARRSTLDFMTLCGTSRNCNGGPTPWGTWLSCEETTVIADPAHERDHGYVFEVPLRTAPGFAAPWALTELGRFNHEAAVVDPRTGMVYMTEDRNDGCLYRFVPNRLGVLSSGGTLQALKIEGAPGLNTSNQVVQTVNVGERLAVSWVNLRNVRSPRDDLRSQAVSLGAAIFRRGEGMEWGQGAFYFACTDGGLAQRGQIWRFTPSKVPFGGLAFASVDGELELFAEPNDATRMDRGDGVAVSPWGTVFVCEDGNGNDHIVGITPAGGMFHFARNVLNSSEMTGAAFSPDGTILFVNIQTPGQTFAITGPW